MKYLVANFNIQSVGDSDQQTICDLLCATLGEVGFESFAETENGIDAYIQEELFDKNTFKQALEEGGGYIWGTAGEKWTAAKQKELGKTTDADRAQGRQYG